MRTGFSARMQQFMYASNTNEVFATLIQISHPKLTNDLCYVNKTSAVNGNKVNNSTGALIPGQVFQARSFYVPLPSEMTTSLGQMTLTIDNVDLAVGYALLGTANGVKPDVWMQGVLLSDTNTPQFGPCRFKCLQAAGDTSKVALTLSFEDALNEIFPEKAMTPYGYPALFNQKAT